MNEIKNVQNLHYMDGALVKPQPSPCHVLVDGAWVYSETAAKRVLNKKRSDYSALIESRSNAVRNAIIGDPAKTLEYTLTATEAELYLQDGGEIPSSVQAWADFKSISPAMASAEIISKANQVKKALSELRVLRFKYRTQGGNALSLQVLDESKEAFLKEIYLFERKYA